jgi:hypothetical protein
MPQTARSSRFFTVPKTVVRTQLGLPEVPLAWAWEGQGRNGLIAARISDVIEVGVPLPNITRTTQRWILTPFEDIRLQWFSSYPPEVFARLSVSFDATNVIFNLHSEE